MRRFFIIVFLFISGCSRGEDCRETVRSDLFSPGTAVFGPLETDRYRSVTEVRGRVDSDNVFGATVRVYFVCRFEKGRTEVAFGAQPFDDFTNRLAAGRPVINWNER